MRKNFLKEYEVTLTTKGPIHIGSGETIQKKEWILDRRAKKGYILDKLKFFNYLSNNDLIKSYEDFMLRDSKPLNLWVNEKKININSVIAYAIECDNVYDVNTIKELNLFIKDAYGKPYIPGSSLKGALRSAIISGLLNRPENRGNKENIVREIRMISGEAPKPANYKKVTIPNLKELKIECKDEKDVWVPKDYVMNGIRVLDSEPLSIGDLTVCQKIDMLPDDRDRDIPTFRECIKVGTKIRTKIVIDETVVGIDIDFIKTAIGDFLENYNDEFLSKFPKEELYNDDVIYLGGGVGFHSKTVTSSLLADERDDIRLISRIIDSRLSRSNREKHNHGSDSALGVSPHTVKLTDYDNSFYQFGPCKIEFKEV